MKSVFCIVVAFSAIVNNLAAQIVSSTPSTFDHYRSARSLSLMKDTLHASESFRKIDPYYFICENNTTPRSLDSIFLKFSLDSKTKNEYRKIFNRVYGAPKSEIFKSFKIMFDEDQRVRELLNKCADSNCILKARTDMRATDSIHFTYLRNRIRQHGWPCIADGSIYAQFIALHNHGEYAYLLPILKTAVVNGLVDRSVYNAMVEYQKRESGYEGGVAEEGTHTTVFDCSQILYGMDPGDELLMQVRKLAREKCPIKQMAYRFDVNDSMEYIKIYTGNGDQILGQLELISDAIDVYCPTIIPISTKWKQIKKSEKKKLRLYVTY